MIKKKSPLIIVCIILTTSLWSQVTIGLNENPVSGALLQLKNILDVPDGSSNSTKGLKLPCVTLSDKNQLFPMFEEEDAQGNKTGNPTEEYTLNKSTIDSRHIALMVYHISSEPLPECAKTPSGLYVWDGNEWIPTSPFKISSDNSSNYDPSTEILTDIQNQKYNTADFGAAGRWMTENLRTTTATVCDVKLYQYSGQNSLTEAQYHWSGSQKAQITPPITWSEKEGMLYNWIAATSGDNENPMNDQSQSTNLDQTPGNKEIESTQQKKKYIQGICPKGWHLPSDREWNELSRVLSNNPSLYSDASGIQAWNGWELSKEQGNYGSVIKANVTCNTYNANGFSYPSSGTKKGFYALLIGDVNGGSANDYGRFGYFWTSSAYSDDNAMGRQLDSNPTVLRLSINKGYLLSIRCKKDE